jgi:glycosyltransferase involved in cell wall biosynthesis
MNVPDSTAPVVSVIVPAYNTAGLIAAAIESVFAQTAGGYEIIVINDGSPDTPALERALEPYRDRITYLVQQNKGIAGARNTAIAAARGRYLAFLDSDDAWEPDYLAVQLEAMEADPGLAAVYPDARLVGDHPHAGRTFMDVCPSAGEVTFSSVVLGRCCPFVSSLVRRDAVVQVGMFDEELRSVEDFHLWLKLLAREHRIGYHRRVLVRHLKRRGSLSADPIWMGETLLKVLDKLDREEALTPADRAALQQRRAFFRARLDLMLGKRAFFRLDTPGALHYLERANAYFRSWRLRLVWALMRVSPAALLRLYRLRDRLLVGADTSF